MVLVLCGRHGDSIQHETSGSIARVELVLCQPAADNVDVKAECCDSRCELKSRAEEVGGGKNHRGTKKKRKVELVYG